jgi:hypothetical protein
MASALGMSRAPWLVREASSLPALALSRKLGATLAELDFSIDDLGLPAAAAQALTRMGVTHRSSGDAVGDGPRLVLANHPGAYDALALMSTLNRPDLQILAAERSFLRALPRLSRQLLFVGEARASRAATLRRAATCLRQGGAILHFPAGRIEPDADFEPDRQRWLESWQPGLSALVRATLSARGRVLVAGVRGVHSPRAKRLWLNRLAERRGITTLAPLLQMVGRLKDVVTRVTCLDARLAGVDATDHRERLRAALVSAIERA